MKQHRLREGEATAVDTKTQLTTAGSDTAPGPLMVPKGMKFITKVRASAIQNMAAATSFSAFVRLEGPGLVLGPQTFAVAAGGNDVATGGNFVNSTIEIPVNLPVVEGNEVQIFGEMAGTDIGQTGFVVGLEFSDTANDGAAQHKTITVEGDLATVDSRTALTTQGSVTSPSLVVPTDATHIDKLIVAAASEGLADGNSSFFVRLGGNAVLGGEQLLPVSAAGRIAVQAGSDAAPQCMIARVYEDLQIPVSGGDTISFWAEMAGVDTGTGRCVVTAVFASSNA
jgi:hypothetical protein